ncbi:MAG: flagellar hook protein FlgE [Lachnospiraceae bacterium]|nr:flagellar hook protein FlgE [Lachnospiraceae bacterium]
MMRSLYSGVAGLRVHQTKMDVIGNNIANVNTVGFKSSTVSFSDVLYQKTQSASASSGNVGGTNAKQIGLGTAVSSIYTDLSASGSAQNTNNTYDLMIEGSQFFILSNAGGTYFTKVGSFTVDGVGNLVTYNGEYVMGWEPDPDDPSTIKRDIVKPLAIESDANKYADPEATTAAYVTGNIDKLDTKLTSADGHVMTMTIYDKQGYSYTVKMKITQDTTDTSKYNVTVTDVVDSNNVTIKDKYNITFGGADLGTGSIKLSFDAATGKFVDIAGGKEAKLELTPTGTSGDVFADDGIAINFENATMYSSSGSTNIAMYGGDIEGQGKGKMVGTMIGTSINTDGKIYGTYDNGEIKLLGQIAVASFSNASGLEKAGNNLYVASRNSGEFDGIGEDISSSGGKINQGVIEMSNVDLSKEFTEMITTQRGFQANSRIITTSDTMLEELVNLKR